MVNPVTGSQLALAKKYHLPLFLHSRAAHADFVKILREEGFGEDGGRGIGAKGGVVHSFTGSPEEAAELVSLSSNEGICCAKALNDARCRWTWGSTSGKLLSCWRHTLEIDEHRSLNGCGMKTEQNLAAVKAVRPDKIMFETGSSLWLYLPTFSQLSYTDSPWCSMTSTHASKPHIQSLPPTLHSRYFPQAAARPESFVYGRPVKGRNEPIAIGGVAWVVHRLHETVPFERITERAWKNTVEVFGLHELA